MITAYGLQPGIALRWLGPEQVGQRLFGFAPGVHGHDGMVEAVALPLGKDGWSGVRGGVLTDRMTEDAGLQSLYAVALVR